MGPLNVSGETLPPTGRHGVRLCVDASDAKKKLGGKSCKTHGAEKKRSAAWSSFENNHLKKTIQPRSPSSQNERPLKLVQGANVVSNRFNQSLRQSTKSETSR